MRSARYLRQVLGVLALAVPGLAAATSYPYQSCFEVASRLHDVPLDVLLAVAATESNWDPDARSHANAHGLMQIQWPGTARHLGVKRVAELYNPCLNIDLGARYLRELLDSHQGDLARALAAYNYGPGRIGRSGALPAGAVRYVATVSDHRARIARQARQLNARAHASATPKVTEAGAGESTAAGMRFDSATRARRFTDTLNARISGAQFRWQPDGDAFVVSMVPSASGLTLGDGRVLEALGWPGLTARDRARGGAE